MYNLLWEIVCIILSFWVENEPHFTTQVQHDSWAVFCIAQFQRVEIAKYAHLQHFTWLLQDLAMSSSILVYILPIRLYIQTLILSDKVSAYVDKILQLDLIQCMSNLKELEWSAMPLEDSLLPCLTRIPSSFGIKFLQLFQHFDYVTTLTLQNYRFASYCQFSSFISSIPQLQTLCLYTVYWLYNK